MMAFGQQLPFVFDNPGITFTWIPGVKPPGYHSGKHWTFFIHRHALMLKTRKATWITAQQTVSTLRTFSTNRTFFETIKSVFENTIRDREDLKLNDSDILARIGVGPVLEIPGRVASSQRAKRPRRGFAEIGLVAKSPVRLVVGTVQLVSKDLRNEYVDAVDRVLGPQVDRETVRVVTASLIAIPSPRVVDTIRHPCRVAKYGVGDGSNGLSQRYIVQAARVS